MAGTSRLVDGQWVSNEPNVERRQAWDDFYRTMAPAIASYRLERAEDDAQAA